MNPIVRALLRLLCPRARREEIEGDLLEVIAVTRGVRRVRDVTSVVAGLAVSRFGALRPRNIGHDLVVAWRSILRRPAFSAAVIGTLAIGIGANTAIFSLINAVLLRPLPVQDPAALALVSVSTDRDRLGSSFPYPFYEQVRQSNGAFAGVLCSSGTWPNVETGGQLERVAGELVSPNYFEVLGVRPHIGRVFTERDVAQAGGDRVVVLGNAYWQRRFGGDPAVIGRAIRVNDRTLTIIGVTPPEFFGLELGATRDMRFPVTLQPEIDAAPSRLASSGHWWLQMMVRRAPGMSLAQTEAALGAQYDRFVTATASSSTKRLVLIDGRYGRPILQTRFRLPLTILTALAGLVLMLVCLNVANLMFARDAARQRELAIIAAIGATPARLVRLLLVEAGLLASIGGAIGFAAALWSARALTAIAVPAPGTAVLSVPLDRHVLAFATITAAVTALMCSLAPALRGARTAPALVLGSDSRTLVGGRLPGRRVLIGAQMAVSLAVLVGAGLFVRTLANLQRQDVGFETAHLALFTLNPQLSGYDDARVRAYYAELSERVRRLGGVRNVALGVMPLLNVSRWGSGLRLDTGVEDNQPGPLRDAVGPGYFHDIGMPIVLGRDFTPEDRAGAPGVAIVNEAFARRYLPGGSALGRRIGVGGSRGPAAWTIVGVVRDSRVIHVRDEPSPFWYVPYLQLPGAGQMTLHVRTFEDPAKTLDTLRDAVVAIDPRVTVFRSRTMSGQIDEQIVAERLLATLATAFGVIAAALASIGLYGVLSLVTASRTREVGVRMALGATPRSIVGLVIGDTSWLIAGGLGVGLLLAWAVGRQAQSLLFDLDPADPATIAAAVVLLTSVTALATLVPAARAARIDPLSALRTE